MTDPNPGFTIKRRGAIGTARADFMCNSATCRTKKGARVYELPAASVKCPVCSKKLTKLMSAPNISTGRAKKVDAMTEPEYQRQREKKDAAKEAQRRAPMLAVDPNGPGGLAGAVARATGLNMPLGAPGVARPTLGVTAPDLAGLKSAGMNSVKPTSVRRWTPTADDINAARSSE